MNNLVNARPHQTILIVDDNPNNLQLLFKYLKKVGYRILIAQSGKKAIETAKAHHPDLILLDVMMPNIDGFVTCHRLKSNSKTKDIPVIFMTALKETENKVQGFKSGAVDYITKPIKEEELLARIETHLSLQSLRQNLAQDAAQQKLLAEISDRIRQSLDLKLILETATKEIRALLDCDLVWLAQKKTNQNISIKAYASSDITIDFEENISYDDFLLNPKNHQNICYTKNLDGNIFYCKSCLENKNHRTEVNKNDEILTDTQSLLNPQSRLIAPILINPTQSADSDIVKNTLWGWLIADQYKSCRQWQTREVNLIEKLTTQLAIAIKQGLLYEQLFKLTIVDSLTNLYNRRYFDQQLYKEWYRLKRNSSPLSLIICDVDCFKQYNDTYGHQLGDECLQQVAEAIASAIKRPGDVLTRYGGEEFAAILPNTPESGAIKVAEDMRIAVKKSNIPHLDSSAHSVVTISVGIASIIPNSKNNPDLLLKAADLSLYESKERGRDCITVYSEPISTFKKPQEKKKCWIKHLRQALQENLFSLYAHPIVPLEANDNKKYFEILLRLPDENNGVISPNLFLDIAERNSLITDIDTWVVN
ncbi:MAG: diguanylate cyclase, partial [Rivularia sp. ALOHA_DT_140]|nr:diguanylate cyclase [Rivularia sp. ALOHA_DT_140]